MNQFKCPKCHIISDEFAINDDEEERLNYEKNYDLKVEEFKKIVEEHNKNTKEEYYDEVKVIYTLGIFPHTEKIKKSMYNPRWKLYNINGRATNGRSGIYCGITTASSYEIILNNAFPIEKKYEIMKYDKYKFIECKICGFKQYI